MPGVLSLLHRDYDFPSGVAFLQIRDRCRDLTQLVSPVDDRFHFSGLHEITQNGQVLLARVCIIMPICWLMNGDNTIALSGRARTPMNPCSFAPPLRS